jgi:chromosome segregation ATPase
VEVPPPIEKPPALADLVKELRSVMEECGGVREQLKAIRKDFQEVTEELARIRNRSQEARKELQDAESALHELRRSVETFTSLPQDVQNTAGELGHVRKRTGEIRKELVEAEKPLVELRNTLLRIGEEQQNQSKVLQTRFHTLEGECRDVEKQLGEVRGQVGNLRSAVHDGREEARISREAIREDAQDLQAQLDELREQVEVIRGQVVATGLQARIVEQVENKQLEQALSEPRLQIDEVVEREPIESAARSAAPKRHLGVTVDPSAKVLAVIPDTPAEKAGLRPGDVIVNINGKPITNSEDLRLAVEQSRSDEEVELIVARGVETHEFDVGLSEASVPETPA